MPGTLNGEHVDYTRIPGPLGLASASLEGKVALVTGAGRSHHRPLFSQTHTGLPHLTLLTDTNHHRPRYWP
jgi:hypothetical protein